MAGEAEGVVITVPTLTYRPTSKYHAYDCVSVAQSWTVWTYQGVRYGWQDGELFATDTEGRKWRFNGAVGIWVHVQGVAA